MGCRQSTMEGKEQVVATRARCKERMKLMEDAVQFRNHFAASQASYAVTLKWTGEVLTDYSLGEVQHLIPPSSSSIPPPSSPSSSSSTSRGSSVEPPLPPPINSNIPFLPPPSHLLPQRPSEMKQLVKQISSSSSSSSSSSAAAAAAADGANAQLPPPINSNSNIPSPPPPPAFPQHCSWEKKRLAKLKSAAAAAGGAGLGSDGERKITACAGLSENLAQRFNNLNDDFLKASESAHEVSKMMEATRMNYEPNFADNRGYIDPSARIMQVITWNRAFRGLPCEDDEFSESERENLANVLDKMLAWEKKLYEEMKACELMKIEYLMMVALFNKQKKCGASPQTLEETQVAFNHLHARYIAELQSMNWTVSEINNLQDNQLYMRLVDLVGGLAEMWETMHAQHTSQLKIIWDLKNLDFSLAPKETSEQHLEGTVHLHGLLGRWSSEFQDLVRYEKAYIRALNDWVNLNLIPIESNLNDEVSSPPCILQPAIQRLLQTWHNLLEKLPYKQAIDAIDSFRKAVHVIIRIIEEDELKMKRRCEETRRKYMRKSMRKYKKGAAASEEETASGADPENREMANRGDTRTERNGVLERLKMRLTDDEESYQRICKQVREKAVQSIRTHLVEFIRAMAEFALACSEMYRKLRSIATRSQNTMMAD